MVSSTQYDAPKAYAFKAQETGHGSPDGATPGSARVDACGGAATNGVLAQNGESGLRLTAATMRRHPGRTLERRATAMLWC